MLTVFQRIAPDFDASDIISEKKQSSSISYYKDAYNDKMRKLVAQRYKQDIRLFDYTF